MTTLMLFWGLSLQGQSNTNFGSAIARTNAASAEQISIDTVQFVKYTSGCTVAGSPTPLQTYCYTATVYVRNFGDQPFQLAGINLQVLASGYVPGSLHCEVTTSTSSTAHLVVVARFMQPVVLTTSSQSSGGWCTSASWTAPYFPENWDGQTLSIQVSTASGTQYHANYAVPP